jgi:hypothetical protein
VYQNVQTVSSNGKIASASIKTISSGGRGAHLHWLTLYSANAGARYAMLFDATALPADGAAPMWMQSLIAQASVPRELAWPPDGLWFTQGIFLCISTTPDVKTLAAADLIFTAGVS